jgi:hypothetical protein
MLSRFSDPMTRTSEASEFTKNGVINIYPARQTASIVALAAFNIA